MFISFIRGGIKVATDPKEQSKKPLNLDSGKATLKLMFAPLILANNILSKANMEGTLDDNSWVAELESALLLDDCDFGVVRNISKGRPLPPELRADVWQIALNVAEKGNLLGNFNGLFDLPEQAAIRTACKELVDRLGNDSTERLALVSDLEEIITFYSKSTGIPFKKGNGWTDLLQLLSVLKLPKPQLYNCFQALVKRYIPTQCEPNGRPFHLFRLLLLYHEPEMCSFLDTHKITPDQYGLLWFRSLFAQICDIEVCLNMWDVYLQQADPFLLFFLTLVLLVNAKEQVMQMATEPNEKILETLTTFPSALEAEDIEDFCSLAQYYASRTPQSFRRHYESPLFGVQETKRVSESSTLEESQALCLSVCVDELLHANELGAGEGVRYFVIDCRPAEQYNAGHLPTAYHLDAQLMLENPVEFRTALNALTDTQTQALQSGSSAAGEHLCFLGSGREQEDQYVHMVISNFLQNKNKYVGFARGGYLALHDKLIDDIPNSISDHNSKYCIVCNPSAEHQPQATNGALDFNIPKLKADKFFGKLSNLTSAVKSKTVEARARLSNYIKNEFPAEEGHLKPSTRVEKGYKNMTSVFSIGDDDEDDDDEREVVNLELWLNKPDVKHSFVCQQVRESGECTPSHLLVTDLCMYVLRDIPKQKGMAMVLSRHALKSIVKITSKKKMPELITFKYGSNSEEVGLLVTEVQRFMIEKAGDAVKVIKMGVHKLLESEEEAQASSSAASGHD